MRRAPKFVLVIAALLGLFGQTVAVAASPTIVATIESPASPAMPMDCLGMMQRRGGDSAPCDRMTIACIAGMGCSIPVTLDAGQPVVAEVMMVAASPACPLTSALEGQSIQPELHPPCSLA